MSRSEFKIQNSKFKIATCGLTLMAGTMAIVLLPTGVLARSVYPPEVVQEFVRGCESSGQPQRFCSCTIDRIQGEFSLSEFMELSRQMLAVGTPPRSLMRLVAQCVDTPAPPAAAAPTPDQATRLNTQLQAAVAARDWDLAIQVVDRMIALFPEQSAELTTYRSRLESLRGR